VKLTVHVHPSLFDTSYSVWLNPCIEWSRDIFAWYLKRSSFFGINNVYHPSAFSQRVQNNLTEQKNIFAINAYIGKARAPFNTLLKIYKAFVVIVQNQLPLSLNNSHWGSKSFKLVSIQASASSQASFSSVFFLPYTFLDPMHNWLST